MVSVIIPIFNVEKYLYDCVLSVLNQTYRDIEIILVDDGSTDKSKSIVDELSLMDSRIRVVHRVNGGLSVARNSGLNIARGNYILLVDGDDMLPHNIINRMVEVTIKTSADIVSTKYIRCKEKCTLNDICLEEVCSETKVLSDDHSKMKEFLNGKRIGTFAWGKLYRKNLFDNIRYPIGKYHEDIYTTYKLIHEANTVVCINDIGYIYRENSQSITSEKFSPRKLDAIYGKIEQAIFIREKYPDLAKYAYAGIIYSCNKCIVQIANSEYKDIQVLCFIQKLYRKHLFDYWKSQSSLKGKIVATLAFLNIYFTIYIISILPTDES